MDTTRDLFLGGKLALHQPKQGYRAAIDPILLAAGVQALPHQHVLELGIGTAAAALCLLARCPDVHILGVEKEGDIAALARKNADENGFSAQIEVLEADITTPRLLCQQSFHHVMMNPPFHDATHHHPADGQTHKGRATHTPLETLQHWLHLGGRRLAPKGSLTLIHRADALAQILAALPSCLGAVRVRPIAAKADQPANRVLISGIKGRKTPLTLLPPLVLHQDDGAYTDEANAILRGEQAF